MEWLSTKALESIVGMVGWWSWGKWAAFWRMGFKVCKEDEIITVKDDDGV